MTVRKLPVGKWLCECYPSGAGGKRIRKQFATKGEALAFERFTMDEVDDKPWLGEKEDRRTLKSLIDSWYSAHGSTLSDGLKRQGAMHHAYECMNKPLANEFSAQLFSRYREKRLNGEFARTSRVTKVKHRTLNLELAYFRAVFNEMSRLGEWKGENPLKNIRPFRTDESEMAYLTREEISTLLEQCQKVDGDNLVMVVKICLSTGARWSEAEGLTRSQLSPGRITFTRTKGKKNRTVPISKELHGSLPENSGRLFTDCYTQFGTALKRCKIELPKGQLTHVLRHTFASHFMMKGGNILVLQRILGHTDIKMTMRYAHFSPDHLDDAIRFNPLADNGDEMAVEYIKRY
ncbi:phage integrase [Yersinia aldovae]|uniref:phage integrase n=1 Tax=Yersinia aldovae TaxID=29483 RepID=UPI0011AA7FE7|nr:tyrosine-type recombinase/integrase [Yersinia aldovae]